MSHNNLFQDEWRACLHAHYIHVLSEQDSNNEKSLITVLLDTGFTKDQIEAIRRDILPPEEEIEVEAVEMTEAEMIEVVSIEPTVEVAAEITTEIQSEPLAEPVEMIDVSASEEVIDLGPAWPPADLMNDIAEPEKPKDEPPPAPPKLSQLSLF
jgi:hypothetical protein